MRLVTESAAGEREPGAHTCTAHTYTLYSRRSHGREKKSAQRERERERETAPMTGCVSVRLSFFFLPAALFHLAAAKKSSPESRLLR